MAISPYRVEGGAPVVDIRLRTLNQLFNSFDPSPFHEQDLDEEAEQYIVASVQELQAAPGKLVFHLPPQELGAERARGLAAAIHNYFAYRQWAQRRRLARQLEDGRIALAIGLTFLIACMTFRELALGLGEGPVFRVLGEGLLISGWVAMWRPIQIFLYDWWPVRRMCRIYQRLSTIPVEVRGVAQEGGGQEVTHGSLRPASSSLRAGA